MGRDITEVREELVFLEKQQKIAEAERRRKHEAAAYDSILKNTREVWRSDMWKFYVFLVFTIWLCL